MTAAERCDQGTPKTTTVPTRGQRKPQSQSEATAAISLSITTHLFLSLFSRGGLVFVLTGNTNGTERNVATGGDCCGGIVATFSLFLCLVCKRARGVTATFFGLLWGIVCFVSGLQTCEWCQRQRRSLAFFEESFVLGLACKRANWPARDGTRQRLSLSHTIGEAAFLPKHREMDRKIQTTNKMVGAQQHPPPLMIYMMMLCM
jgi:hypothetical protein